MAGIILFHFVFQPEISLATGFMEEPWSPRLLNLTVTFLTVMELVACVALCRPGQGGPGVATASIVAFAWYAFGSTNLGLALIPIMAILLLVAWAGRGDRDGFILRVGQGADISALGRDRPARAVVGCVLPDVGVAGVAPTGGRPPRPRAASGGIGRRQSVRGRRPLRGQLGLAALRTVARAPAAAFVTRMLRVFPSRGFISRLRDPDLTSPKGAQTRTIAPSWRRARLMAGDMKSEPTFSCLS